MAKEVRIKEEFTFEWKGRDKTGKAVSNTMRTSNQAEVKAELLRQGIQVISVTKVKEKRGAGGKVTAQDIMLFSRQMATMLQAGLAVSESLGMQAAGVSKGSMRKLLLELKAQVDEGVPFAQALRLYPEHFPDMYQGLVNAGENSGTLETVLEQLADYQEKVQRIKSAVKKALVYPSFVIFLALAITSGILIFVIPVFQSMFDNAGMELPGVTQAVVNMSEALRSWTALYVVVALIIGAIIFKKTILPRPAVQQFIAEKLLKLPLFGKMIILGNSATFARTLGTMYMAGTPMLASLGTVATACSNSVFKDAVMAIRDNVSIGQQLNFAMAQTRLFPEMVVHMVGIGEKSGNLSDMLFKVASLFEEEIDGTVAAMMSLIEPILIIVLGGLVGGLVIAMYLPIFGMASAA